MSDHYFAADPRVDLRPRSVAFSLDGRDWTLQSGSGVFSADRLDPGTRVLLRAVPRAGAGTLLDLGCGYGALACVLAVRAPRAQVWAVDVNQRALSLTRQNAQALGVADRVVVAAADEVPDAMTFDEIWSNPPIRIGKPALHDLLTRWLGRLSSGGQAWLVVARNLGGDSLQRWLNDQGWPTERRASVGGYRVLRVRPRVGPSEPGLDEDAAPAR